VDEILLSYLTKVLQFQEPDARTALEACGNSPSPLTPDEREAMLPKVLDWFCLELSPKDLEAGFRRRRAVTRSTQLPLGLPAASAPSTNDRLFKITSNHSGVKLVQSNWKVQARVYHLCSFGFPMPLVKEVLKIHDALDNPTDQSQALAMEDLMHTLLTPSRKKVATDAAVGCGLEDMPQDEIDELVADETLALQSIYGDDILRANGPHSCTIKLSLPWIAELSDLAGRAGLLGAMASPGDERKAVLHVSTTPRLVRYPLDPPLVAFSLEIIPPEACVEIATMVLERLCGQAGQPSLYTAIDCLLNDMDAFHIAKRHLEARTKARAANPNKGETRTGRRHRKKMMTSHVAPTVGNPKRQEKESDEKVVERLTKAKKSHRQIMIERERLRSREAEEARAKQADGAQQRQRQKLEEAEAAKAKKARADQARKATVESGKARMKKMEESGKVVTLRGIVREVNSERRAKKGRGPPGGKSKGEGEGEGGAAFTPSPMLRDIVAKKAGAAQGGAPPPAERLAPAAFTPSPLLAGIVKAVGEQKKEWPWLFEGDDEGEEGGEGGSPGPGVPPPRVSRARVEASKRLYQHHQTLKKKPQYHKMIAQRARLPAYERRESIMATILGSQVVVISGETGCGKTTQVPQIVLDWMIENGQGAECNMVCTQPRRISAMGVADRVASERVEKVGGTVGYQIRLESRRSAKTRLLLCTTGVLLRRLQCDPLLEGVSHIFVDEIHERDLSTDFLLIILRGLVKKRPKLRLVLMSATLNALMFAEYFSSTTGAHTPIVEIPGRAFPVKDFYLETALELTGHRIDSTHECARKGGKGKGKGKGKGGSAGSKGKTGEEPPRLSKGEMKAKLPKGVSDQTVRSLLAVDEELINYELIKDLVQHIVENSDDGAILIFLPGLKEIQQCYEQLQADAGDLAVEPYALHSSLSTADQKAVFGRPAQGLRKVVVATNIAETSITIDDVIYVIDAGRVKENRYDHEKNMASLVETWVSLASAKQRRGRAGRVQPGVCYHLFSSITRDRLSEYTVPEMHRVPLHEMVLQIKVLDLLGGDAETFLGQAVTPPGEQAVRTALDTLRRLQAIDATTEDRLTPLGYHLATLPVDPCLGKILLYGAIFRILDPCLTIAACMSFRSPFFSPLEVRELADEKKRAFNKGESDHLTLLNAYDSWQKVRGSRGEWKFLKTNFLSRNTLEMIGDMRRQFAELVVGIGFAKWGKGNGKRGGGGGGGGRGGGRRKERQFDLKFNKNVGNLDLYKAVLTAGLYPNVCTVHSDGKGSTAADLTLKSKSGEECSLHPCSVNFDGDIHAKFLLYHERVKTSKVYLRDCSSIGAYPMLLFGGQLRVWHREKMITVDDWLAFRFTNRRIPVLVRLLREGLDEILRVKIINPEEDVTEVGEKCLSAIATLLKSEA
jgi:HrpA-like RNA helicase